MTSNSIKEKPVIAIDLEMIKLLLHDRIDNQVLHHCYSNADLHKFQICMHISVASY